jgi:Family of unknown function (DUF6812)
MITQYDEKGKIFTQVVAKRPVPVIIQTLQNTIRGSVHVRPDERVKDELNTLTERDRFLAVTDAVILNSLNEELFHTNFLVVNVDQIVWILPEEELIR